MNLLAELERRRIVAIVRSGTPTRLPDVVRTLVESGIALVELPLTTPGALEALRECAAIPDVILGAGTVLTAADARASVAAGARYLVTPAVVPEVLDAAVALGVPVLCGAFTATEVLTAMRSGAAAAKIFPASAAGPEYVSALRQPLPDTPLVAVGGVGVDDVARYLSAGATAVGIGSPLVGDAAAGGSLAELSDRARSFVQAVA